MVDNYGREINYLRISLTDKCNLRCLYCMPNGVEFDDEYINDFLSFDDYKFIISSMAEMGINKVRFTGGEPLLYPKLEQLIKHTKDSGIDDVCMTTNAIGLTERLQTLKQNGLSKVNISLDSLKEYRYKSITQGGELKYVLSAIDKCIELGIKVKINCVAIKGFNDDEILDLMNMTIRKYVDVRFIELMPLGEARKIYKKGYLNIKDMINSVGGLEKVEDTENSTADYYRFKNSKGKIGVITPLSCSFCNTCSRLRLTSRGFIKTCLHSKEEIDIKPFINKPLLFKAEMKDIVKSKPERHHLIENKTTDTDRCMYEIGG
ncbi:GTP 3',8-cyclase MoaA [Metaclostridioides mangenotii]|uniref:GTP 3',8-cyclase MoaA n=1 Tax=Metaclostridioides mangenotii TaxID=1540 RepID=UPI0026EF8F80|nr:GTP 3',8-cyclase MoaA [Clostridioides mangenotii]